MDEDESESVFLRAHTDVSAKYCASLTCHTLGSTQTITAHVSVRTAGTCPRVPHLLSWTHYIGASPVSPPISVHDIRSELSSDPWKPSNAQTLSTALEPKETSLSLTFTLIPLHKSH